ncbi:MAG TPA: hypothetical protein PKI19_04480 [Elusimicrobiales bacterium]|nr:hypothetical protein [Elusimicrobiales bacterium]
MNKSELKKRYIGAAITACGIITAIFFYTVVAEILRYTGHKPLVPAPAAYVLKYVFYLIGVSAIAALKLADSALDKKKETPRETAALLTLLAVTRAAICEMPAIAGLVLLILTGNYTDFYLLTVFSIGLEIFHFPRLRQWEERLRSDFGQLPE